jgi:hypothetical protein
MTQIVTKEQLDQALNAFNEAHKTAILEYTAWG